VAAVQRTSIDFLVKELSRAFPGSSLNSILSLVHQVQDNATPKWTDADVRAWIADQTPEAIAAAALGMAERPDSTPDLATIDVPTLVITSTGDRLIPPDVSSAMAEEIDGAELHVLDGAGHLSNLEAPGEFDRLFLQHVRACGLA